MSLSLSEVDRIAHLARIELSPTEAENARRHLNEIFDLIAAMQAVDTQGVAPMAHAQDLPQRLRPDEVTHHDPDGKLRDAYLALAPESEAGLYLVPKVIE